jgi:hypothetical protein
VWFVHQRLGLSGYGFSLDDDAADIGANYATQLGISIGGLNGLPNQVEWSETAPYGPVSGMAQVLSLGPDTLKPPSVTFPYEISGLPQYVWYSVKALDTMNSVPGAQVQGTGVSPGTFLKSGGDAAQTKYSFALGNSKNLPPLTSPIGSTTQYTLYYGGTANTSSLVLEDGVASAISPFTNTSTVRIRPGSTLKITTDVGSLTSFTQQVQQFTRVAGQTMVLPSTVVNGTLDAARVTVADGVLVGKGNVTGSLEVMGPLKGYTYTNSLGQTVTINATAGGIIQPGGLDGTPGRLTIGSAEAPRDVRLNGATFTVKAKGAGTAGTDYGQMSSFGKVSLGNSKLNLDLNGYVPKIGDSLTIITTTGGISGTFSQGSSITVGGATFKITYNATSVVLTLTNAVRGVAFQDFDADGIRDANDVGLANRTVFLDRNTNGILDDGEERTLTNGAGEYVFADLPAGSYRVRMDLPAGAAATRTVDTGLVEGVTVSGQDLGVRLNVGIRYLPLTPTLYTVPHTEATVNDGLLDVLYLSLLGRQSDELGKSSYLARLNEGTPLQDIVRDFLNSREYRGLQVRSYYQEFLGRDGLPEEINAWVDFLGSGKPLSAVIVGFLTSQEFTKAGHTDTASFVRSCYQLLLGRDQRASEGNGWQVQLDAGTVTRKDVITSFLNSAEANQRLVSAVYACWLKRPADAAGLDYWSARLANGLSFEGLAAALFSSQEVRNRTLAGKG